MTREEILELARLKRAEISEKDDEILNLKESIEYLQNAMNTIANLFSPSIWKILPQKIKIYFEQYRKE